MVSARAAEFRQIFVAFQTEVAADASRDGMRHHTARLFAKFGTPIDARHEPCRAKGVSALWITPTGASEERVLVYIHGGGYMTGSPSTHANGAGQLAYRLKARALLPDYRLAPEHAFPMQIRDCADVYEWLLERGYRPENIVFAGESAGGALCITTQQLAQRRNLPIPAAAFVMSPWLDMDCAGESYQANLGKDSATPEMALATWAGYKGVDCDVSDPLLDTLRSDITGVAPFLAQVGGNEILRDDSVSLVKQARKYGVTAELDVVPDMQHMFQLDAGKMPEADAAMDRGAAFLKQYLHASE